MYYVIKQMTDVILSLQKEGFRKKDKVALSTAYIDGVYKNMNSAKEFLGLAKEINNIPRDAIEKVKKDFTYSQ